MDFELLHDVQGVIDCGGVNVQGVIKCEMVNALRVFKVNAQRVFKANSQWVLYFEMMNARGVIHFCVVDFKLIRVYQIIDDHLDPS